MLRNGISFLLYDFKKMIDSPRHQYIPVKDKQALFEEDENF